MSSDSPLRSPLYGVHVAAGAAMALEAGWEMPARYGESQAEVAREAAAARQSAAIADVTHWGRIRIRGDGSAELLARLCGPEVRGQEDDTVRPITLHASGTTGVPPVVPAQSPEADRRDACPTGRPASQSGTADFTLAARLLRLEDYWLILTLPADRANVLQLAETAAQGMDARVDDQTDKTVMIAVLGPQAPARLDAFLPIKVAGIADGAARSGSVVIAKYVALRSDLQGLWRMEVVLPHMLAGAAWRLITQKAGDNRIVPIGTEAMGRLLGETP